MRTTAVYLDAEPDLRGRDQLRLVVCARHARLGQQHGLCRPAVEATSTQGRSPRGPVGALPEGLSLDTNRGYRHRIGRRPTVYEQQRRFFLRHLVISVVDQLLTLGHVPDVVVLTNNIVHADLPLHAKLTDR